MSFLRWFRRRPAVPEPPTNVRFETTDGDTIPVECVYAGLDDDRLHRWVAVSTVPLQRVHAIRADIIPARTSVVLGMTPDTGQ